MSRPATPQIPDPEDMDRVLAAMEAQLAATGEGQVAAQAQPAPAEVAVGEGQGQATPGQTRRVRRLRAALDEARATLDLLAEGDPREQVPTRREQRRAHRAARMLRAYQLGQTPALLAARDARVRRWTTVAALVSAGLALAWSTAGVQRSVALADGLVPGTVAYYAAYLVEPMMSCLLLALVGGQAYAAMRGRPVDRRSAAGRTIARIETALLAATLSLNVWPYLGQTVAEWAVLPLVVHALGPIVAVLAVKGLPALWGVLDALPMPHRESVPEGCTASRTEPRTEPQYSPEYRANASGTAPGTAPGTASQTRARTGTGTGPARLREERLAELVRRARARGLTGEDSAHQIREALGCGMDYARRIRDALRGGGDR